jgi:hypothetical protein
MPSALRDSSQHEPEKGTTFMEDIILTAAREAIPNHEAFVKPFDGRDLLVTVSLKSNTTKSVQGRIPAVYLMEEGLTRVKTILAGIANQVDRLQVR